MPCTLQDEILKAYDAGHSPEWLVQCLFWKGALVGRCNKPQLSLFASFCRQDASPTPEFPWLSIRMATLWPSFQAQLL